MGALSFGLSSSSNRREFLVSHSLDKRLLPRFLFLTLSQLKVVLPMRFSINTGVSRRPIGFAFIGIIESTITLVSLRHAQNKTS